MYGYGKAALYQTMPLVEITLNRTDRCKIVPAWALTAEGDEMTLQSRVDGERAALVVHRREELNVHDVFSQSEICTVVPPRST